MTVAQLPDGTVDGYAAPGLLLLSARQWSAKPNERLLADLAAHQWWGTQITAATPSDVWLTDGLSRYSEGLYVEQTSGKEGLNKALEDFAVGALMFDDSSPIADARRLEPGSEEYQSVVVNKGAMVFHMLRAIIGDANFTALLKDFYSRYSGKAARIQDFEQLAETRRSAGACGIQVGQRPAASAEPASLRPFFTQWLHSTGVPEFTLEYVIYRTKKGFRIVGKAKQNLDVFHMDVEIEVQTEGNPEFKTITISGKESPFTVETFGRPKPNGIILDPHDYILKSSQRLRVRGMIARGESLRRAGPLLRRGAAISEGAGAGPPECAGRLPHGRGIFLPEELRGLGAILPRRARRRHRPDHEVDRGVVAHLSGTNLRHPGRPHTRRQRVQQGQADRRRHRRRASGSGKIPEESLQRNRRLTA